MGPGTGLRFGIPFTYADYRYWLALIVPGVCPSPLICRA